MTHTVFHTCNLCEACCGLAFEVDGQQIVAVRPDEDDVFSRGYICPKGAAITALHDDPDRLTQPVRRTPSGDFEPISWDVALDTVASRLREVRRQHGRDSVGLYVGNPAIHNHGILALRFPLIRALGTRNITSAGSQDTSPRFCVSYYLYGSSLAVPIPDIDRTDYFLCIGANPRASNGSFLTAPDIRGRLKQLRQRGGRFVVVDPRRTESAREADQHVAILPDGDGPLLLAMVQTLAAEGRIDREAIHRQTTGWEAVERRLAEFTPERAAAWVGVDAGTIRRLAHEFANAKAPVAYSRVGVCNSEHGTIATYATDLLNIVTGRLGAIGGWMFPKTPFDSSPLLRLTGDGHNRWQSRVRNLPEMLGELPASVLSEEIETPGPGQIRAMLTVAGNPVLSTPNSRRLDAALGQLDFMASVDLYINETTRHADIILPPAGGLCDDHVDLLLSTFAVRQTVRYSPAVVPKPSGTMTDWEILRELVFRLGGGPTGIAPLDWFYRLGWRLGHRWTPKSTVDLLLRIGPYGDRFVPWSKGLNLKKLRRAPHGIDMGPIEPGIPHRVRHRDRKAYLEAPPILAAIDRFAKVLDRPPPSDQLRLIGRRDLRSNNSWMHNIPELVSGRPRCTLLIHPSDAAGRGLNDGDQALLETVTHRAVVPIEFSDDMRPGVVSLPHGWGHAASAPWQRTAGQHAGVSFNDWVDDQHVEEVVGQSILNGVPVRLHAMGGNPMETASPEVVAAR